MKNSFALKITRLKCIMAEIKSTQPLNLKRLKSNVKNLLIKATDEIPGMTGHVVL